MSEIVEAPTGLVQLGEVAEIVMGQSPAGSDCNRDGVGVPLLNGPTEFGLRSPTPAQWTVAPTKFAERSDLLFCVRGSTTGRMNIADRRYCVGRGLAAVRGRNLDDTRFLHYALVAGLDELLALTTGTVFPNISGTDLRGFRIPWPSAAERQRITEVVAALDDRIEHSIRLSLSFEDELQALYDVLADRDSAPAVLSDAVVVNPRLKLSSTASAPYVPMERLSTTSYRVLGAAMREVGSGARFQNGDTLVARITPCLENGKVGYVDILDGDDIGWGSTEFVVLRSRPGVDPFIPYLIARSEEFRDYAVRHMSGSSGRQRCPADAVERFPTLIPDADALAQFSAVAQTRREAMRRCNDTAERARELRDFLVPRLISGELRVAAAEELVEAAT